MSSMPACCLQNADADGCLGRLVDLAAIRDAFGILNYTIDLCAVTQCAVRGGLPFGTLRTTRD